jgi:hypothetical protein
MRSHAKKEKGEKRPEPTHREHGRFQHTAILTLDDGLVG